MSTILQVGIVLGIMVLVHEFGHFAVAKLCGIRVEVFASAEGPENQTILERIGREWRFFSADPVSLRADVVLYLRPLSFAARAPRQWPARTALARLAWRMRTAHSNAKNARQAQSTASIQ